MFLQDLEALPEEAFTKSFGTATRTVADIVYEVNLVNDHICMAVRGEELPAWPSGWITAPEDFQSKSAVIAGFNKSIASAIETFEALNEDEMERPMTTEHGPTNPYERAGIISKHMWYHSGQLNYIQTILGDDGWHWN